MKTVLITGATSGFGLSLVEELLQKDYEVVATGRSICSRSKIFASISEDLRARLQLIDLDVNEPSQIAQVKEFFEHKTLDCLVNNAGLGHFGPLEEVTDEAMERLINTNLVGLMKLTRELLPALRTSKGKIVNVSSAFGFMGFPLTSVYCASKFAVEGFTQSLALELKPHGVDVFSVRPGGYRTNFLENAIFEEGLKEDVYLQQVRGLKQFQKKLSSRPNPPDKMEVVHKIVQLIEGNRRKSDTVGKDARLGWFLKRFLPEAVYDSLMQKTASNMMSAVEGSSV